MSKKLLKKNHFLKKNKNIEKIEQKTLSKKTNQNNLKKDYFVWKEKKFKNISETKPKKPQSTHYLQTNKKIKQGIFFKKPCFNEILYPFSLNLKLIHEYLKKK